MIYKSTRRVIIAVFDPHAKPFDLTKRSRDYLIAHKIIELDFYSDQNFEIGKKLWSYYNSGDNHLVLDLIENGRWKFLTGNFKPFYRVESYEIHLSDWIQLTNPRPPSNTNVYLWNLGMKMWLFKNLKYDDSFITLKDLMKRISYI